MPIFKFHSGNTKPSSLKIWTTLIDTPIHPREGYTEDQIRYRMFIYLQLDDNFKEAVRGCNLILDTDIYPLVTILQMSCFLASCTESDFSNLTILSDSFPHWVSSELYTPYYLTKMLCHKIDNFSLLTGLFDRSLFEDIEGLHIAIDNNERKGLTAYKLYSITGMDDILSYVTISYDRTPRPVMSQTEMHISIRDQLMQSIEKSDNYIIPYAAKTTIPYFVLKVSVPKPPPYFE